MTLDHRSSAPKRPDHTDETTRAYSLNQSKRGLMIVLLTIAIVMLVDTRETRRWGVEGLVIAIDPNTTYFMNSPSSLTLWRSNNNRSMTLLDEERARTRFKIPIYVDHLCLRDDSVTLLKEIVASGLMLSDYVLITERCCEVGTVIDILDGYELGGLVLGLFMNIQEGISVWEHDTVNVDYVSYPVVDLSRKDYNELLRIMNEYSDFNITIQIDEFDRNPYLEVFPHWFKILLQIVFSIIGLAEFVYLCYKLHVLNKDGLKYQRNLKLVIIGTLFCSNIANLTRSSVDPFMSNGSIFFLAYIMLGCFSLWGITISSSSMALLWEYFLKNPQTVNSSSFKKSLQYLLLFNVILIVVNVGVVIPLYFYEKFLLAGGYGVLYVFVIIHVAYFGTVLFRMWKKFQKFHYKTDRLNPAKQIQYTLVLVFYIVLLVFNSLVVIFENAFFFHLGRMIEIFMSYFIIFAIGSSIRTSKNYKIRSARVALST